MERDRVSDFCWVVLVLPLALLTAFLCLSEPVLEHFIPGAPSERILAAYSLSVGLVLAFWAGEHLE